MNTYYYEEESNLEYVKKSLSLFYNNILFFIFLFIFLVVPSFMAYTGVKNLENCPKQPNIPVYLFVGGATGIVKLLQILWSLWRKKMRERFDQDDLGDLEFDSTDGKNISVTTNDSIFVDVLISIFLIIWFGLGQYWVFSIWIPNFEQPREYDSKNWCLKEVYTFSIYTFLIFYSLAILFILLVISLYLYSRCCKNTESPVDLVL